MKLPKWGQCGLPFLAEGDPDYLRKNALEALEEFQSIIAPYVDVSMRRQVDQHAHERSPGLDENMQKEVDEWFDANEQSIGRLKLMTQKIKRDPSLSSIDSFDEALEHGAHLILELLRLNLPGLQASR